MTAENFPLIVHPLFENIGACNLTLPERIFLLLYRFKLSFQVQAILIGPKGVGL